MLIFVIFTILFLLLSENIIQIIQQTLPKNIKMHSIIKLKTIYPKNNRKLCITIYMILIPINFILKQLINPRTITLLLLHFDLLGSVRYQQRCDVTALGTETCLLLCADSLFLDDLVESFVQEVLVD